MPPYIYSNLNQDRKEIRLLTLLSGAFNEPVRIEIKHKTLPDQVPLTEQEPSLQELQESCPSGWHAGETFERRLIFWHTLSSQSSWTHPDPAFKKGPSTRQLSQSIQPAYEALSYAWGSTELPRPIQVVQGETKLDLLVSHNLFSALRHLRLSSQHRTLWIDAICINQNDVVERSQQIKLMTSIYKLARRVVVWLGEEADHSDQALSTLQYLGQQIAATLDGPLLPSPGCAEPRWHDTNFKLPYTDQEWVSIFRVFQRPWFTRLWVYQEIQLANYQAAVQCGKAEVSWFHFRRAVLCIFSKRSEPLPGLGFTKLLRPTITIVNHRHHKPLARLLNSLQSLKCTDPRDKIYALLGVVTPEFSSRIRSDYSLSVSEIYTNAFLAYVEHFRRLDLLQRMPVGKQSANVPSWVPDWTTAFSQITVHANFAGGLSRAQTSLAADNVLEVTGVHCATVLTVSQPISHREEESLNFFREKILADSSGATLASFSHGWTKSRLRPQEFKHFNNWPDLQDWKEIFASDTNPLTNRWAIEASHRLSGNTCMTLDNNFVGLSPALTQPGDYLCVFLGLNMPIVLRPVASGEFKVVGACYVHGLMDGEGLLGPMPPHSSVRVALDSIGLYTIQEFQNGDDESSWTPEDPRLGPLPGEWMFFEHQRTSNDPLVFRYFRNTVTGQVMNSDPRMLPEALAARGVPLRNFKLV